MFLKILTILIVLLAGAWMLLGGRTALPRGGSARSPIRAPRAHDLVSCARCGIWLPAGQRCDCAGPARVDGTRADGTRADGTRTEGTRAGGTGVEATRVEGT